MAPRPTPTVQPPPDDPNEFARKPGSVRFGGPRDFARLTEGSKQIGGKSEVKIPEPY